MVRQPTLKQLRYLCAVAEHQHFGHAAAACHVSQSTLSAWVLELEETLGASLVERNNRKVFLTSLGSEVVERARDLLVDVEDMVSLCAGQGVPFQGRMRMGVIPTVAPYLLPGLLGQIRSQYPEFKLFIREDLSNHWLMRSSLVSSMCCCLPCHFLPSRWRPCRYSRTTSCWPARLTTHWRAGRRCAART